MRWAVVAIVSIAATGAGASAARAQGVDRRYAEEPTDGVALPTAPIAGEYDARTVATNAGGLALLRGQELALALDVEDVDHATSSGQGFGIYYGAHAGGGILPHFGLGVGLEWLRPSRANLDPDPGSPFRFTLAYAQGLGRNAGIGLAWHHFHDDGILNDVNTFDLGLSTRWGNHLAVGANVRDLATNPIGGTPVQRRYELEADLRPLGTSTLDVAVGGRIGETRGDVDYWGRISARVAAGVLVHAQLESRDLHVLADSATGIDQLDKRDYRATLGLELSFGRVGVTALGTGLRDDTGANHALSGELVVRASQVPTEAVQGETDHIERIELEGKIGVRQLTALVRRMRAIARDPHAVAVVVTFDAPTAGWATFEELHDEITHLRAAHKKVFAYLVSGSTRDYLVASACDRIYLDPAGGLRLIGLAGHTLYFRGLFDLLGVLPQFEKIGEYKSAPEQLTERGPSAIAATMHDELYGSLWDGWLAAVAAGRHLTREQVKAIVDAGPYDAGQLSRDARIVDGVGPPDRIAELVVHELGRSYPIETAPAVRPRAWKHPGIAVIYVDGDIVDGKSQAIGTFGGATSGGITLTTAISEARTDPDIGAIVLRIDSPGGSALASELIAREVFAVRGVKPILCSMSDYAASGGYFVAAGCDEIFAEPMTITGSIGIFSGKLDITGLLGKLGIGVDTYQQGAHADADSSLHVYSDAERAAVLERLRYGYSRFVGAVADGRKLTRADVDSVGRGHVWTGVQARPIALVDALGGLGDALDEAQRRMGLPVSAEVRVTEGPDRPSSALGSFGRVLGGSSTAAALDLANLPLVRAALAAVPVSVLLEPDEPQARLPFALDL